MSVSGEEGFSLVAGWSRIGHSEHTTDGEPGRNF